MEKTKEKLDKKSKLPQKNKELYHVMYLFTGLFVLMFGYLTYFLIADSQEVINNPYNLRQENYSNYVVRGTIFDSAGNILANTRVEEDGSEVREYPNNNIYAHVVGYSQNGETGLEKLVNFYLLTSNVPIYEKIANDFTGKKNLGNQVVTTLNSTLQSAAYEALGDRNGAVVVMEPSTGKILAMVSKPDYNPNQIMEIWEELTVEGSTNSSLLNRATQGLYPPGSIFKIATALEYMREFPESYSNFEYYCTGVYTLNNTKVRCYHGNAHGSVNFTEAFAQSCNGAFAQMGTEISIAKMNELANALLYNQQLPISLEHNSSSYLLSEEALDWEIIQTAIGQGQTLVAPMHQALITSAIANGGVLMMPYIVDNVRDAYGNRIHQYAPEVYETIMTAEEAAQISQLMISCVEDGTGHALRAENYTAAGKTGTAEWDETKESHGWFVGFAPADHPKIVVSVVVEEGGAGSESAAPIARKIIDAWAGQT